MEARVRAGLKIAAPVDKVVDKYLNACQIKTILSHSIFRNRVVFILFRGRKSGIIFFSSGEAGRGDRRDDLRYTYRDHCLSHGNSNSLPDDPGSHENLARLATSPRRRRKCRPAPLSRAPCQQISHLGPRCRAARGINTNGPYY